MISIKYNVGLYNPVSDKMKPSENFNEFSTIKINEVSSGIVVQGFYKRNKEVTVATDYSYLGEDFYLKSDIGSRTTLEPNEQSFLDVSDIFGLNGKLYADIPNNHKIHINRAIEVKEGYLKTNHIISSKGDAIFFEILPDTTLKLLKFEFEGSSNLIKATSSNIVIYFIVNKTMRISVGKPMHVLTKDMENLPNGFCKLSNELVLNNNTNIEKIETNRYVLRGKESSELSCTFPIKFDNIKTKRYVTTPSETVLLDVDYEFNTNLKDTNDLDLKNNLTALYEIKEDGSLEPYLLIDTLSVFDITDNMKLHKRFVKRLDIFTGDSEFKKKYIVRQYKVNIKESPANRTHTLYDDSFLKNITYDKMRFNKKMVTELPY